MPDPLGRSSPWRLVPELTRVGRSIVDTLRDGRIPSELKPPAGRRVEGETSSFPVSFDEGAPLDKVAALARDDEDGTRYLLVWLERKDDGLRCYVGDFALGQVDAASLSDDLVTQLAEAEKRGWHLWADAWLTHDPATPGRSTLAVWLP